MNTLFSPLGVKAVFAEILKHSGITAPTPVQKEAIPAILSGQDTIVQAQTGTGKTLAFVLPIVEKIDVNKDFVQALIITPTRELAIQITSEVKKLAEPIGAKVLAAYGGQDVEGQIRKLKQSPQIVVATPGRLLDHLRRETIKLSNISMLVIDEADEMLDMGFWGEMEEIIRQTPRSRQTMLFSATMPDTVRRLASEVMKNPTDIVIKGNQITIEDIKQYAVEVSDRAKQQTLIRMIETFRPYLAIVFCRTKIRAKKLTEALIINGIEADELHGDLSQAKRENVMKRFRTAKLQILVATDVAARGIDVEGVTHVFNYDIPQDADSYIHRIGRTGRAGQTGFAYTFVAPRDQNALGHIEKRIKMRIPRRPAEAFFDHDRSSDKNKDIKQQAHGTDQSSSRKDRSSRSFGSDGDRSKTGPRSGKHCQGRNGAPAGKNSRQSGRGQKRSGSPSARSTNRGSNQTHGGRSGGGRNRGKR